MRYSNYPLYSLVRRAGIAALLTSLFSISAGAATFTVTNLSDRGPGSLRQAVIDANAQAGADTIKFASGVTGSLPIVNTIKITDDLELVGPGADQITVSGIGATLFQTNATATVTISKLKLTDGWNSIENQGKLTVSDCTISGNDSSGIYNNKGSISLTVNNSTISGNSAVNGSGIYNSSSSMSINDSTISGNTSSENGGGIYNASGSVIINNSTISGNTSYRGGGIYNASGSVTVNNSTISGNASSYSSGIYNVSSMTINNSTISGNNYSGIGNANPGKITFNNSTISGNNGYGIVNESGATINNSTISGNSSDGIHSYYGSTLSVGNSLVAGNNGSEIYNSDGTFLSLGYNLFGQNRNSGLSGATPADTDIILVGDITTAIAPLADNGGPTQTHLLTVTSQALDSGSNSLIPAEITTDQRGAPRIEYGVVDIGAVEGTEAFVTASTFDLLINKVGNGTITSNPTGVTCNSTTCTGTFDSGTLVKLTAKPATGYIFSGWSGGGCSGTGICEVNMTAAQTVEATFIIAASATYSLSINKSGNGTVTSNPSGIKCGTGSACAAKFASNKVVTLIAKPDTGATFVSWSGCVALTTNPLICRVTMSNNKTVTATFGTKNTAATAADVRVMSIVISPVSPAANSNFTAAITVKNAGNIKSDGGYLDVWADQATLQTCKAASDTWEEVGQLAAGESKTITVNLKVRGAGAKQLRAFVDSQCTVTETNETNNQLTKSYTVK
ncbi:choice-of-anchor Q domain-containing protein [Chromatium okenii]|uniref:Right handed beta helix domain-containing protein n=1 Tax=Chromatium okenii TaxID=61644 RepID=A0A2S7XP22_9GAMM|nr:choice-of-anchor Q domain-containing protein [Chromatium okenii]MBV5309383.1 right-handed parallel beta-helix repeat-containing protein [Chromatium okenii]PQJ95131.1 hypothetical protein CXB77_12575 [Chromatium okenii]